MAASSSQLAKAAAYSQPLAGAAASSQQTARAARPAHHANGVDGTRACLARKTHPVVRTSPRQQIEPPPTRSRPTRCQQGLRLETPQADLANDHGTHRRRRISPTTCRAGRVSQATSPARPPFPCNLQRDRQRNRPAKSSTSRADAMHTRQRPSHQPSAAPRRRHGCDVPLLFFCPRPPWPNPTWELPGQDGQQERKQKRRDRPRIPAGHAIRHQTARPAPSPLVMAPHLPGTCQGGGARSYPWGRKQRKSLGAKMATKLRVPPSTACAHVVTACTLCTSQQHASSVPPKPPCTIEPCM